MREGWALSRGGPACRGQGSGSLCPSPAVGRSGQTPSTQLALGVGFFLFFYLQLKVILDKRPL